MTSTVITPQHSRVSLPVPPAYVGKRVRVTFVVIDETVQTKPAARLSDKYRGVFSPDDAKSFNEHTKSMRSEW